MKVRHVLSKACGIDVPYSRLSVVAYMMELESHHSRIRGLTCELLEERESGVIIREIQRIPNCLHLIVIVHCGWTV